MSSSEQNPKTCPLCQKDVDSNDKVIVGNKGADGINKASINRGVDIIVSAGTAVHKSCRTNHINKKDIERCKNTNSESLSVKRSVRISSGCYNSKTDCLFCGNTVVKVDFKSKAVTNTDYSYAKTDSFVDKILVICKTRDDEWAFTVKGRIEYFGGDLHAADCIYHHSCDSDFRCFRDVPTHQKGGTEQRKVGRPTDSDQEQTFLKMCTFLEENDEEQLTVSDLANKMSEYLVSSSSVAYGNCYLKCKLLDHCGDLIFISEVEGLYDIVTFRDTTNHILRSYFSLGDEDAQKKAVIETAARLIKSYIKTMAKAQFDEYPNVSDLTETFALQYFPEGLRLMLQNLFVGTDISRKVASIGQSIIQAVRPRAVVAPLQLGLAMQIPHLFRSRFIIEIAPWDIVHPTLKCGDFEENAASSVTPNLLGSESDMLGLSLLFAGDNVDHNLITLDEKSSFHGMGMIAAITPRQKK